MTEDIKPDPNNALTWPEHSPSVAMDVDLGRLGRRQNFDMPAYNRLLDQQKVGKERADLHIKFKQPGKSPGDRGAYFHDPDEIKRHLLRQYPSDMQSVYTLPKKYMEVSLENSSHKTQEENNFETNRSLRHETRHFTQDTQGNLLTHKQERRRQRLYSAAVAAGGIVVAAAGIRFTGLGPAETATLLGFSSPLAIVPSHFIGKEIEYQTNPNEKDARRFTDEPAKEEAKKIFSSG